MRFLCTAEAALLLLVSSTNAISLDINDKASIRKAASTVAWDLVSYYNGNETGQTPGVLPNPPYYWWESGGMFNTLINYWYYTGDDTYNDITMQGIVWQGGGTSPGNAFMPTNQTFDEGNDDQMFWAFAAMSAAEYNFPNPPSDQPQWLELAQGVFNTQAARWSYDQCGGGIRWQFNSLNAGFLLLTSASNGGFFNLAARLGAYTGNPLYFKWAIKSWDWMVEIGLLGEDLVVFDNTNSNNNCTTLDHSHWSYTTGMILNGAAVMWNATNDTMWQTRTMKLWNSSLPFFFLQDPPKVMHEHCEPTSTCDNDQVSFKAYLSRFMAASTKVAPWLYDYVKPYLEASALAAAAQCSGGDTGTLCGYHWSWENKWDGTNGVGQQLSALEVIQANLIQQVKPPVTSKTGGTSKGDPNAGTNINNPGDSTINIPFTPSTADRAGAGVLTAFLVLVTVIGAWWMVDTPTQPIPMVSKISEKTPRT